MEGDRDRMDLFAPGPVYVPERIRRAMAEPMIHHRTAEFKKLLGDVRARLRRLWHAEDYEPLVLCCSGTGAMEGAVVNFMRRDAKALVVSAGKFGERWTHILRAYGCQVIELQLPWGSAVDPQQVIRLIDQYPEVRAVYLTSADTSTGVEHLVDVLGPLIRARTDALIVVDAICDFGGARDFHPRQWNFDVVISCSQKCLALPPGVVVAHVAPRAWEFCQTADLPRFYFDWCVERAKQEKELITAWTSPVSLFRGLQEALTMLEEEGLANVVGRYARNARAFRAALTALGLRLLPDHPTNALSVVRCPPGIDGTRVVARLQDRYRVRVSNGQDQLKGQVFRVGHMGFLGETDILGLVHVVECALADLGHKATVGVALAAAQHSYRVAG